MTITTTDPLLETEKARVDAMVRDGDTAALRHRLRLNAEDQRAWYGDLPITREWLAYERDEIAAELSRRERG